MIFFFNFFVFLILFLVYKSALGPNDNLTQGTLDHITANRDKFQPEEK